MYAYVGILWTFNIQYTRYEHKSNVLNFYINSFRKVCTVQYGYFFSSLISFIAGTLLRYCLSDYEMVSVAPTISGIILAFAFHIF